MTHFPAVLGQHQAIKFLESSLKHDRLAPAYLFIGQSGIGRELTANYFALAILSLNHPECRQDIEHKILSQNYPDLLVIEPTYQHQGKLLTAAEATAAGVKRRALPIIRLEQVQQVCRFLDNPPLESSRSVVIIRDTETMTESAANALLKTLEEPKHGLFILITKSLDSVLPTLVSRCQYIKFNRLSKQEMRTILREKDYEEILDHPDILELAQSSPGEAIESFNQYQTISQELRDKLKKLPTSPIESLMIAKAIESELDVEKQLWLIGYLQQQYWELSNDQTIVNALEKAKRFLLEYVQPRLVWETFYLSI